MRKMNMVLLLILLLAASYQMSAMHQVLESDCASFTLKNDAHLLSLTHALQGARVSINNGYYHIGFIPASILCSNEHIFHKAGATTVYNVSLCTKLTRDWSIHSYTDHYLFEQRYEKLDIADLCLLFRTRSIEAKALRLHQQANFMAENVGQLNEQIRELLKHLPAAIKK